MILFDPSYLGLVRSLRAVAFSARPRCPEVALNDFALTVSVSRGRFGVFTLMVPVTRLDFGS